MESERTWGMNGQGQTSPTSAHTNSECQFHTLLTITKSSKQCFPIDYFLWRLILKLLIWKRYDKYFEQQVHQRNASAI